MKKILVISFYLFSISYVLSQNCKRLKEEIDPISGLPVLIQKQSSSKGQMDLYFSTNHRWIHLNVSLDREFGRLKMNFNLKDPIKIIFTDATSLILFPSPTYLSSSALLTNLLKPLNMSYVISDDLTYSISKENVEILAAKTVKTIRIYYSLKIDDYCRIQCMPSNDEFKEYHYSIGASKLSLLAKCILAEY